MKTFKKLTVGDGFFSVRGTSMEYKKEFVSMVDSNEIRYGYSENMERFEKPSVRITNGHGNHTYLFVNEADVIRFCKARMMKTLFAKIESAKLAIKEVRDFREKHYELLNHQWTQKEINKLEKSL